MVFGGDGLNQSTKALSNETKLFCRRKVNTFFLQSRQFEEGIHDEGIKSATGGKV